MCTFHNDKRESVLGRGSSTDQRRSLTVLPVASVGKQQRGADRVEGEAADSSERETAESTVHFEPFLSVLPK